VRAVGDYSAVRDAVLAVRELLRRHITLTAEAGLAGVPIDARTPREIELANLDLAVSLWLHRLGNQPDLLNRAPARTTTDREAHVQTPVELCLLVVPMATDATTRLLLLGRLAQVLTDHRRLSGADLVGSLAGTTTELQLGMDPMSSYDLSLLWGTQQTFARPSVGLRVQGVAIDSHLPPMSAEPVLFMASAADQITGQLP
jgi:hypothetical protein